MIELTSRTSGTSEIPSSTSRSSASVSSASSTSSPSSTARAPNASDARIRRRISPRMSSREATASSSWSRVPRRSSSMVWTFPGSATAIRRVFPSSSYGTATTRSRTCSGTSLAASSSTPVTARSTNGIWKRLARVRAMPSGEATPSSSTACENAMPCFARPRTSASLSPGTSPVASIRSATSSASSLTGKDDGSSPPAACCSARPERSFGGRSRSMRSLERGIGRTPLGAESLEGAQVGVEQRVARKQRDDRAEGEERCERDAHLARLGAVPGEQEDAGNEPGDHPDHQADCHGATEHCAQEQRQLDVPHAHPAGVGERRDEEEARGAQRAQRPLGARLERRLRDQDDRRGGQDDPVRDDPVGDVGRGDRDEDGAEKHCDNRLAGEAEREEAGRDEPRGGELDGWVEPADRGAARAAAAAQDEV